MILFRKLSLSIIVVVFAVMSISAQAERDSGNLKIILRYDDYSDYTSMEVAASFIETAKKVGAGVLIGVIPYPYGDYPDPDTPATIPQLLLSPKKIALLKKYSAEGAIEIADHGFSHQNNVVTGRHSEFSGLPEAQQVILLRTAKEALETATGAKVRTFVPPFNQYDAATLKALKATGFQILSAGMESLSRTDSNLLFLPGTTYIDQLKEVVSTAISQGHTDALVIVTVHPYDIVESGEKLPKFSKGRRQVSMRSIRDDLHQILKSDVVQASSISTLLTDGEDLSIARWQANLRVKQSAITNYHILPDALHLYPLPGLYYSTDAAEGMLAKQKWSAVTLYGGLALVIALIIRMIVGRVAGRYRNIPLIIGLVALSGVAGLATLTFLSGFHTIFAPASVCCLGMLAGVLAIQFAHVK